MNSITIKVPGKLMLSGEWGILELGMPAVVMAVDKFLKVRVKKSKGNLFSSKMLGMKKIGFRMNGEIIEWLGEMDERQQKGILFAEKAIETALKYLDETDKKVKGIEIEIDSEISGEDTKIGLGSSAALCVGIVAGILKLNGIKTKNMPEKLKVFKLACIAHYLVQKGIGSGYDVAAAVFGGLLLYKRFDGRWLGNEIEDGNKISWIVEQEWPALEIEILEIPKWLKLNVAYSGKYASTTELIKKMDVFKSRDSKNYRRLIEYIGATTEGIAEAIKGKNLGRFLELLSENRRLLKELAAESGLELETDELIEIVEAAENIGCAGKFSGAGGGDCAIAFCPNDKKSGRLKKKWKRDGFKVINVKIAKSGAV